MLGLECWVAIAGGELVSDNETCRHNEGEDVQIPCQEEGRDAKPDAHENVIEHYAPDFQSAACHL